MHLNRTNSVLTKKSNRKYSCKSTTYSSRKLINWDEFLNIAHLPKLSLAQIISTPHIISSQLDRLEKNYQSEYLWFEEEQAQPKVLVVEDRDDNRDYICSMLRTENLRVIEAEDSNSAIDIARSQCRDLIICDLMMPVIDGYGIQYILRRSAIIKKIPLLFVAGNSEKPEDSSRLILIENESAIKPLTNPRLLAAISYKLKMALALDLIALILAGGRSSGLVRELREERQLVMDVDCSLSLQKDSSMFTICALLAIEHITMVENIICDRLERLQHNLILEVEITRAKRQLINDYIFSTETPSQLASIYGFYNVVATASHSAMYPQIISRLQPEQLQAIAQKYLSPERYAVIILKPS